jgi:hypothetical protein
MVVWYDCLVRFQFEQEHVINHIIAFIFGIKKPDEKTNFAFVARLGSAEIIKWSNSQC